MAIKKPANTTTYKFENRNPKGRRTTDCVVRAISKATDKDWCDVLMALATISCETGYMLNETKGYGIYLERLGFKKQKQPRKIDNTKYTLSEFIRLHKTGTYLVHLPHHLTVVKNGKCYDTWNCSKSSRRVGNYWAK